MLIAVHTRIIIEVRDEDQAQDAAVTIEHGLVRALGNFPAGEVVSVRVDDTKPVSAEEAETEGWTE